MIKGILLDIDGTVVKSNDAHAYAWEEALKEFGYNIAFEKIRPLLGMGGDQLLPRLVEGLDSNEGVGKKISEKRKEIFLKKHLPTLEPAPGAKDFVEKLQHNGIKIVVASSAKEKELKELLKVAEISDLITEYITSDEVEKSKPAPDIIAVALEKINLKPEEVFMVGDTPYDIEAARKCGVKTIAVRSGGFSDSDLSGSLKIYDDLKELLMDFDSGLFKVGI